MLLSGKFVVFPFIYEQDCSLIQSFLLSNIDICGGMYRIYYITHNAKDPLRFCSKKLSSFILFNIFIENHLSDIDFVD